MRIAIDYTAAIRQGAGIGAYARNLVAAMLAQDTSNHYTLLTSGHPSKERPFPDAENVQGRSMLIPDRYLNALWYRWQIPLPATFFSGPTDIYHGPDFVLPPSPAKFAKWSQFTISRSLSIPNTPFLPWLPIYEMWFLKP